MRSEPGKILYNGLLVRNKPFNFILRLFNYFFFWCRVENHTREKHSIKKILICNNAHLGDVLLSTAILPSINENYPNAEIHFLCASWSKEIVESNPMIKKVYFLDHWKLNRSSNSFFSKLVQYFVTFRSALNEIKNSHFDISIDLYFYYPNSIFLLWLTHVPMRIGYTSGGYGNLLTHSLEWKEKKQSVIDYHFDLLRLLPSFILKSSFTARPVLTLDSSNFSNKVAEILAFNKVTSENYIIIHVGTGLPLKEWPSIEWKSLIQKLNENNYNLFFTGYGSKEKLQISELISNYDRCFNLCNKLNLLEFAAFVRECRLIVCLDSLAGHIASIFNKPCVVIGNGINPVYLWKPVSLNTKYIINEVPCMPCYTGCYAMECIRKINSNSVYKIIVENYAKIGVA